MLTSDISTSPREDSRSKPDLASSLNSAKNAPNRSVGEIACLHMPNLPEGPPRSIVYISLFGPKNSLSEKRDFSRRSVFCVGCVIGTVKKALSLAKTEGSSADAGVLEDVARKNEICADPTS